MNISIGGALREILRQTNDSDTRQPCTAVAGLLVDYGRGSRLPDNEKPTVQLPIVVNGGK